MGYRFSRQTSFLSFSLYQLLYDSELVLPSAMRKKLHPMMDLNDQEIWLKHCRIGLRIFERPCLWLWRTGKERNIAIYCVMLALEVGLIGLSFSDLG